MQNLDIASRILSDALGTSVRLDIDRVLSEDQQEPVVVRCKVSVGDVDPVIVKRPRPRSPYLPDEPGGSAGQIFNEWAALEWLGELDLPAPRLLAADRATGLLVMTEMHFDGGLHDLLLGDSASAAKSGMVAFAEALGVLHSATLGGPGSDTWAARRGQLGPETDIATEQWFQQEVVEAFREMCSAMEIHAGGADQDLQEVVEILTSPGTKHALTHGDPCPDNFLMYQGSGSLIDFESASWRPAALDSTYFHVPFPTCWCIGAIPEDLVEEMESVYRSRMQYSDDEWGLEIATACALWFLRSVPVSVSQSIDEDRRWGTAGNRGRVALRSKTFAAISRRFGRFDRLAEIALQFERRAKERWGPDAEIQLYPAFR